MSDLSVPDDAVWYVRTGLDRALTTTRENIKAIRKRLEKLNAMPSSEISEATRQLLTEQSEGIIDYHEQWLREAIQAYASLPKELQPTSLDEH